MRLPAAIAAVMLVGSAFAVFALACVGRDPVGGDSPGGGGDAGSTSDAGADASTSSSGGTNVVVEQGGFETTGCLGWEPNEVNLTADPDKPHGGSNSCRVCSSSSTSVWGIFQDVKADTPPGSYVARGFMRASGDAGPSAAVIRLQTDDANSRDGDALLVPGGDWVEVKVELAVEPGKKLAIGFFSKTAAGCFSVDDATLTKK